MYELLKDNHNPEMLKLYNKVFSLNKETDLGWHRDDYTPEEAKEYYEGKLKLLNYFGIEMKNGEASIE